MKPFAEYQRFVTSGQQQLSRTGWVGLAPSVGAYLDPLFRSNSLDNLTSLESPDVDTRLRTAAATSDAADRTAQYQGLEKDVMGLFPVVPLGSYEATVRMSARVQHYVQRLDGTFDALQVEVGPRAESRAGAGGGAVRTLHPASCGAAYPARGSDRYRNGGSASVRRSAGLRARVALRIRWPAGLLDGHVGVAE